MKNKRKKDRKKERRTKKKNEANMTFCNYYDYTIPFIDKMLNIGYPETESSAYMGFET